MWAVTGDPTVCGRLEIGLCRKGLPYGTLDLSVAFRFVEEKNNLCYVSFIANLIEDFLRLRSIVCA